MSEAKNQLLAALQPYRQRWQQLGDRDRLALSLLGGFFAVLIMLYGIILPSYDFHQQSRDRYLADTELLHWLQNQETAVQQIQQLPAKQSRPTNQSPLTFVTQSAKQHQLSLKRVQPEGSKKLRLWLEAAPMDKTLAWLKSLTEGGLVIDDISIERQPQPGLANIRATLITR
ncbi:hypothetical protein R50073_05750 [Maricurvus nonylphenolicus]|uniref:type II secretion system protein GspM n=1 Tax=Maricurvus nonylphenolicus TaxID=1008307 RepID=UPI0036F2908D